jgi:hypothetical protein
VNRRGAVAFFFVVSIALTVGPSLAAPEKSSSPVIRLSDPNGAVCVEIAGLSKEVLSSLAGISPDSEEWRKVFAVYVERAGKDRKDQPAMLGTYRIEKGVLRFEPRFPLVRGVRYRAVLDTAKLPGGAGRKALEVVLSLPKPAGKATTVVAQVYPSADRLPENLLKFYLHFSAPMSQGDVYRQIKLLDAKGKAIDMPFLELDQELWDPTGTRFTLFFDPGRIKRGLKPREEVGPSLEEGKSYTLVIDRGWQDAKGNPLKDSFRKSFSVGKPDDAPPETKTWKLKPPAAGSRLALLVTFPKSMDHSLLNRLLWVVDARGEKVPGKIEVTKWETVWSFTPEQAWTEGSYHLVADTRLEDLSGNTIGQPFEVDVLRPVERAVKTQTVKIAFGVKK